MENENYVNRSSQNLVTNETGIKQTASLPVVLFLLSVVIVLGYLLNHQIQKISHIKVATIYEESEKPALTPSPKSKPSENKVDCDKLTYEYQSSFEWKEPFLIDKSESEQLKLIFNNKYYFSSYKDVVKPVIKIQYIPEEKKVLYLSGEDFGIRNNADTLEDRTIQLYDLETYTNQELFRYKTTDLRTATNLFGPDFDLLTDFFYNPKTHTLIITTVSSVFQYNFETSQAKLLYSNSTDAEASRLQQPMLSEDGQQLLLTKIQYESATYSLFDMNTKELTDIFFNTLGGGEYSLDWIKTEILYGSYENASRKDYREICTMSITGENKNCISLGTHVPQQNYLTHNQDDVYFIVEESQESGQKVCNNVHIPYDVRTDFQLLKKLNVKSKEVTTLLKVDATNSSGVTQKFDILDVKNVRLYNNDFVIVKITDDRQEKFAVMNEDGTLSEIKVVEE